MALTANGSATAVLGWTQSVGQDIDGEGRQAGTENLPFYKRSVFASGGFLPYSLTASAQDEPSQIFKLDLFGACGDCPISGHRFSCVRWSRMLSL